MAQAETPTPVAKPSVDIPTILEGRVEKEVVSSTTADGSATQEIIQIYRDAGAIGVAMISVVLLAIIMAVLLFRVLKMYTELSNSRDVNENLRSQNHIMLAEKVSAIDSGVRNLFERTVTLAEKGSGDTSRNSELLKSLEGRIIDNSNKLESLSDNLSRRK